VQRTSILGMCLLGVAHTPADSRRHTVQPVDTSTIDYRRSARHRMAGLGLVSDHNNRS
jgi:hypothetical protein